MSRKQSLTLILLGFVMALLGAIWVRTPGYMDADYYYAIGQQLARGHGFLEPFIWTYITNPVAIQHPANLYWMPLTSILAAVPMALLGVSFRAAQLPFLLLSGLLPLGVARFAFKVHGDPAHAYRSGWFAAFTGFFFPYFLTTDMFIVFAWIGLGVFYLLESTRRSAGPGIWFLLGALVGVGHLARADGWLLLLPVLVGLFRSRRVRLQGGILLLGGYLLVMTPWFLRNIAAIGAPLSPGVGRSLWLTSYAEFFSFPPAGITPDHWLGTGLSQALLVRIKALGVNVERAIAENGLIFLTPFIIVGGLKLGSRLSIRLAALYGLVLMAVMTFIFPFAGMNGGVFHSSAALMPVIWCLVPVGIDRGIEWGVKRRGWDFSRARALFHPSAIFLAALFTLVTAYPRVVGPDRGNPRWTWPEVTYREVGGFMSAHGSAFDPVAVNNPPGYWVATGTSGIVVPAGGPESLLQAIERYDASWVILDANRPDALKPLYEGDRVPAWLEYAGEVQGQDGSPVRIYRFVPPGAGP